MENLPWMNRWWILARGNRKTSGKSQSSSQNKGIKGRYRSQSKDRAEKERHRQETSQCQSQSRLEKSPAWRVKKAKREQSQVAMAEGRRKRYCGKEDVFLVFGYDVKWSNCQTTSFEHFFYLSAFFKWLQSQLRFTVKHIHLWRRQEWTAKHVPRRQQRQGFSFLLAFNFLAGKMFLIFRFRLSTTDLL